MYLLLMFEQSTDKQRARSIRAHLLYQTQRQTGDLQRHQLAVGGVRLGQRLSSHNRRTSEEVAVPPKQDQS